MREAVVVIRGEIRVGGWVGGAVGGVVRTAQEIYRGCGCGAACAKKRRNRAACAEPRSVCAATVPGWDAEPSLLAQGRGGYYIRRLTLS